MSDQNSGWDTAVQATVGMLSVVGLVWVLSCAHDWVKGGVEDYIGKVAKEAVFEDSHYGRLEGRVERLSDAYWDDVKRRIKKERNEALLKRKAELIAIIEDNQEFQRQMKEKFSKTSPEE